MRHRPNGRRSAAKREEATMIFSHSARLLAIAAFVLGLLMVLFGFSVATGLSDEGALARYSDRKSSGQVIDRGIYTIFFAVALGTLSEISFSVRRWLA
jgi:hypothetical protein